MDVVIVADTAAVARAGAERVAKLLARKPAAVLGLATGNTPIALYRELVRRHQAGELSFADVTTFNLDEYHGLASDDPDSYRQYMQRELYDHVDIDPARTFLPACAADDDAEAVADAYEICIREVGGIDLQLLGIGANGHIGFNEPGSSLASRTRLKTLTRATLERNRALFPEAAAQPAVAMTMGIGSILDTREVLLLATGEAKAEALQGMVEGPVTASCPASALQLHARVTVLADEPAASRLESRDYYDWTAAQKRRLGFWHGEA